MYPFQLEDSVGESAEDYACRLEEQLGLLAERHGSLSWGTVGWVQSVAGILTAVLEATQPTNLQAETVYAAVWPFELVFRADAPGYRVMRFSTLQDLVVEKLVPAQFAQSISAAAPAIEFMVHEALAQLYKPPGCTTVTPAPNPELAALKTVAALVAAVRGCICTHFLADITQRELQLPAEFELVEDEDVRLERATANSRLSALKEAHAKISQIENMLDGVQTLAGKSPQAVLLSPIW